MQATERSAVLTAHHVGGGELCGLRRREKAPRRWLAVAQRFSERACCEIPGRQRNLVDVRDLALRREEVAVERALNVRNELAEPVVELGSTLFVPRVLRRIRSLAPV